ncbi:MAG TPA: hypothetical protein VMY87_10035 [Armatimonadota bacterium]|nr:hypothetical protein [Armatimonadota bacterium]
MTKAATRRLPNGQRKRQPASTKPAAKPAAKPKTKPKTKPEATPRLQPQPSGRVMTVRSRRPSFRRAGLLFTSTEPTTVRESEIGKEQFERIVNEPQLRCELTEK